jgi:hypothetical protein
LAHLEVVALSDAKKERIMKPLLTRALLTVLLASCALSTAQTNPINVPQPPTADLSKFDPFLGKYEVSGDFANLPWSGTLELKKVIKGWYIQQTILVKSPGIDREFWVLATWDKTRQDYPLWGFQTLPLPAIDGEVRFEGEEMITQWTSVRPDGTKAVSSNRYRFVSKDEMDIVSYRQVGSAAAERIGFLHGRRIEKAASREANQQIDPAFLGYWTLNVDKSDFAGRQTPKGGFVNWGEHGWTLALATADGRLYADAVDTDEGCHPVGVFSNWSCEVEVVSPRHVRLTMKQGEAIRRVGDIELLEDGTTRTTHRVTPRDGASYVETTIWEKQAAK